MMDLHGKNVTVVGMGRTGVSLARWLVREGAHPFVTERGPATQAARDELDALGVAYETGGHGARAFDETDLIVLSPGVSPSLDRVAQARARGVPVTGETELVFPRCRSRIIAVTGTNGKTTTTELLRALVAACGHEAALAGNNARPLSSAVLMEPAPEFLVLEVSSYQLEQARRFRPWIGLALNVTPDHLARHGTLQDYAAVKALLFAAQGKGDAAVVNEDDPWTRGMAIGAGAARWGFSQTRKPARGLWINGTAICEDDTVVADVRDIPLRGRHNIENVLGALTVMRAGGFDWERTCAGLLTFRGVEHRIEFVAEKNGAAFYNDSKSTNLDSLRAALESFDEPVILIAGGQGKGSDYRAVRDVVGRRVKGLVTLGRDAPLIEAAFGDLAVTERAADMADAVKRAAGQARPGYVVLLSPACASFDMYDNFEERGRDFKACVLALNGSRATMSKQERRP